jgi:hypothetical protein
MDDFYLGLSDPSLRTRLREQGHVLGEVAVRRDGRMLVEIDGAFMFGRDALEVATRRTSVAAVRLRNVGRVFPESPYS